MERDIAGVTERLVQEFSSVPWEAVVEAVCDCAGACREANPFFVEQAARAVLGRGANGGPLMAD